MSPYRLQLCIGLGVLFTYLVLMLFVATAYIRLSNRRWLEAHQDALRIRLDEPGGETGLPPDQGEPPAETGRPVPGPGGAGPPGPSKDAGTWWSPLNWIGSCEIAAWVRLHEQQRLEVWQLPDVVVQARFARAMGQIDELSPVRQNAWQRRWAELQGLSAKGGGAQDEKNLRRWRAELSQLLAELFNVRDATYNQLVSLYGKAGWLVMAAYLPVVALLVGGYGLVLLAGFLGGLISRMQRVVYGKGRPTAYGTSWVPLFLAPLLGALAAWAGLHLLTLLKAVGVVDLSGVIGTDETYRDAVPAAVLGIGVLLGFSERFFNQLGDQAEKVISGDTPSDGSAAAAGSPMPSFPAPVSPQPTFTVSQNGKTAKSAQGETEPVGSQPAGNRSKKG
jgi:hypothetical protein